MSLKSMREKQLAELRRRKAGHEAQAQKMRSAKDAKQKKADTRQRGRDERSQLKADIAKAKSDKRQMRYGGLIKAGKTIASGARKGGKLAYREAYKNKYGHYPKSKTTKPKYKKKTTKKNYHKRTQKGKSKKQKSRRKKSK